MVVVLVVMVVGKLSSGKVFGMRRGFDETYSRNRTGRERRRKREALGMLKRQMQHSREGRIRS